MKRVSLIAAVAALCVGLVAPTAFSATISTKRYKGDIDVGGTVDFKVRKSKRPGHPAVRKVISFKFSQLPVECDGGDNTSSGEITFKVRVRNGKFNINGVQGSPQNPTASLRIHGELKGPRNASGTIRVRGSQTPVDVGGSDNCDSKTQDWSAKKV